MPSESNEAKSALGYLTRGTMSREFIESVEACQSLFDGRVVRRTGSCRVDLERNALIERMLEFDDVDRFMLVDDDHSFQPGQVERLLSLVGPERPVVSGLYFAVENRLMRIRPLVLVEKKGGVGCTTLWDYPRDSLVPVDMIGLGFVAIWRDLLLDWQRDHGPTWFDYDKRDDDSPCLEDEAFSRRVRRVMDLPIYVHTGICVLHHKTWAFSEADYDIQQVWHDRHPLRVNT